MDSKSLAVLNWPLIPALMPLRVIILKILMSPLLLVLGLPNVNKMYRNLFWFGLRIFCLCQIRPLTPASRSSRVIILKWLYISRIIGSRQASKCENNLEEIMACESFASVNFFFDLFFKVNWGHYTKTSIYLIYWSLGLELAWTNKMWKFPPSSTLWKFLNLTTFCRFCILLIIKVIPYNFPNLNVANLVVPAGWLISVAYLAGGYCYTSGLIITSSVV